MADGLHEFRFGPHYVPDVDCSVCGTGHHPDATALEEIGRCWECGAFLRRPTEAEDRQFTEYLMWRMFHEDGISPSD